MGVSGGVGAARDFLTSPTVAFAREILPSSTLSCISLLSDLRLRMPPISDDAERAGLQPNSPLGRTASDEARDRQLVP